MCVDQSGTGRLGAAVSSCDQQLFIVFNGIKDYCILEQNERQAMAIVAAPLLIQIKLGDLLDI